VLPFHRKHLRTSRRVWRIVVLATHTPLTRVLPGPQAAATSVIMLSGCAMGAGVIACADVAMMKARPAIAINRTMFLLLEIPTRVEFSFFETAPKHTLPALPLKLLR
jgi:hypothetical protein